MSTTPDLLAAIIAATQRDLAVRQAALPIAALAKRLYNVDPPGGSRFYQALERPGAVNVIAECKRRSPSRGVLAADYDPAARARAYVEGGASAISVLTEPSFFDGSLDHLAAVRAAVDVPILRKDFIVHDYQLLEAALHGADAVLLIVAALTPAQLARLHLAALRIGLAVLVEVHDETELAVALDTGCRIVGVNNRNLRTLEVSTGVSERLAALMPADVIAVSESGLTSNADVERLRGLGYRAFLVGERLMTAADPAGDLRALRGGVRR